MPILLKITKHANDKMMWLGINEEQIKNAILHGAHFRQTDGNLAKYTYINVAYKKISENTYLIKTVYVDQG